MKFYILFLQGALYFLPDRLIGANKKRARVQCIIDLSYQAYSIFQAGMHTVIIIIVYTNHYA